MLSITKDKLFNKAVRYAKDGQIVQIQREILDTYQARIAEGKKLDQKQETKIVQGYTEFLKKTTQEIEKLHNSVLEKLSSEYQVCCAAMDVADSEIAYRNCAKRFRKICGYQDSEQRMTQCEEAAAEIKQEEEQLKREKEQRKQEEERLRMERNARRNRLILISIAGVTALVLAVWLLITKVIIPGNHYKEAESLLAAGNKAGAALAFYEIGNYRDAWERSMALWGEIVQQNTIATGSSHTVGLKVDGTVVAVGNNEDGQCDVDCWTDIMAVAAGFGHTVGLKVDGTVAAVGYNQFGQCDVDCWTDIMAVAAGDNHTVGLKADGTVVAVGYNEYGQCDVNNWTDIVAVTADDYHTVGLKADGTVVAVGNNKYGECDVDGWTDIVAVAAGAIHTVGLRADGTVVAVGWNQYGQCDVSGWSGIKTPR